MEKIIKRLLELGMDLSTKNAVKTALGALRMDDALADDVLIKVRNELNKQAFSEVPYNERALFLPHCMRHAKLCRAEMNGFGYECRECGKCKIANIKRKAEKLGYKVYIVPGGSMVFKIIVKTKPKAIAGVACFFELEEATGKATKAKLPHMMVTLSKDGCKDTDVSSRKVIDMLKVRAD